MKTAMALTGLSLCVFLVVHVLGNTPLLSSLNSGRLPFNHYAQWLSQRIVIKAASLGTLAFVLCHAWLGMRLNRLARLACGPRPKGGIVAQCGVWRARYMAGTGIVLGGFLAIHLFDFWYPYKFVANIGVDAAGRKDLYGIVFRALQSEWRVGIYLLGVSALGFHLNHGVSSASRSLGMSAPQLSRWIRFGGLIFAVVTSGVFAAMVIRLYWAGHS